MNGVSDQQVTDRWAIYNGDCMDMLAAIPEKSIHATIYSPPFSGLYHYSSDDRDVSNAHSTTAVFTCRFITPPGCVHLRDTDSCS